MCGVFSLFMMVSLLHYGLHLLLYHLCTCDGRLVCAVVNGKKKKGKLLGYGREEMHKCNIFFFLFQSFYQFQLFCHFLEKRVFFLSFLLSIQVGDFLSKSHLTQIQSSCDFDDFRWCHRISHFKFLECSMIWLTPAELQ